ncbi:unnamed protein product [Pleuronectes platessa]|uniref:Uncharacterized protein n=1 Tax=Pleuronectes platessa TaxID=8262 RepID=A0A9N7TMB6_PLEPL|nr:unnamed protein product [Pleuronectes platessa]
MLNAHLTRPPVSDFVLLQSWGGFWGMCTEKASQRLRGGVERFRDKQSAGIRVEGEALKRLSRSEAEIREGHVYTCAGICLEDGCLWFITRGSPQRAAQRGQRHGAARAGSRDVQGDERPCVFVSVQWSREPVESDEDRVNMDAAPRSAPVDDASGTREDLHWTAADDVICFS